MRTMVGAVTGVLLYASLALADEAAVAPPERLVVDGVPAVPAELAETLGRYGAFRSASLVDWHPTQAAMLISTRFADTPQLHWENSCPSTRPTSGWWM